MCDIIGRILCGYGERVQIRKVRGSIVESWNTVKYGRGVRIEYVRLGRRLNWCLWRSALI